MPDAPDTAKLVDDLQAIATESWEGKCYPYIRERAQTAATALASAEALNERLVAALKELHAMVWGECPSLLNEDSGGSARLDVEIREALLASIEKGDGNVL